MVLKQTQKKRLRFVGMVGTLFAFPKILIAGKSQRMPNHNNFFPVIQASLSANKHKKSKTQKKNKLDRSISKTDPLGAEQHWTHLVPRDHNQTLRDERPNARAHNVLRAHHLRRAGVLCLLHEEATAVILHTKTGKNRFSLFPETLNSGKNVLGTPSLLYSLCQRSTCSRGTEL